MASSIAAEEGGVIETDEVHQVKGYKIGQFTIPAWRTPIAQGPQVWLSCFSGR